MAQQIAQILPPSIAQRLVQAAQTCAEQRRANEPFPTSEYRAALKKIDSITEEAKRNHPRLYRSDDA